MKIDVRIILFSIIIIICILAVGLGVYWQFFNQEIKEPEENQTLVQENNMDELSAEFKYIFENSLDYQEQNVNMDEIIKINAEKDLIYTWVSKENKVENKYDLKVNIPRVNIASSSAQKFNEKIKEVYVNKANDIILNSTANIVYTVEYMSYINSNILSLVIKSTLKEENNPQRVMIQTYNYNLSTNEEVTFKHALEIKGLQEVKVKETILKEVQEANLEAQELKALGYVVYMRDLTDELYEIENTNNFILGKDNYLYIIYPYGNTSYTGAMDVIVL